MALCSNFNQLFIDLGMALSMALRLESKHSRSAGLSEFWLEFGLKGRHIPTKIQLTTRWVTCSTPEAGIEAYMGLSYV